jgi:hypothetical protein
VLGYNWPSIDWPSIQHVTFDVTGIFKGMSLLRNDVAARRESSVCRRGAGPLDLAGLAGVAFFAFYLTARLPADEAASALWACHLASLMAGLGILFRRPALVGMGVLWLLAGIPLWCVYLAIGGEFRATSALTHIGGLAVGCYGLKAMGMPRQLWWKAIVGLLLLLGLSRWMTPPELNVNLAFHVYQKSDPFAGFHAASLAGLTFGSTLLFFIAERSLRRLFPEEVDQPPEHEI